MFFPKTFPCDHADCKKVYSTAHHLKVKNIYRFRQDFMCWGQQANKIQKWYTLPKHFVATWWMGSQTHLYLVSFLSRVPLLNPAKQRIYASCVVVFLWCVCLLDIFFIKDQTDFRSTNESTQGKSRMCANGATAKKFFQPAML